MKKIVFVVMLLIITLAALWRMWIIDGEHIAFNSDEAVVGLMARHISEGKGIPTFYYGQDYMGSLDAILIAGGFLIVGDSVDTIRYVQLLLFIAILFSTYWLALTISASQRVALLTLLLTAFSNILALTYTSATLGGYNEILLLGNLVLGLGWMVTIQHRDEWWLWLLLGAGAGVGWWVNGAIVTPIVVVGLMGLAHFSGRKWPQYLSALGGFLLGSWPWWLYNLRHDWAALSFLLDDDNGAASVSFFEKLLGFFILGFPTLYGLRMPWEAQFLSNVAAFLALLVFLFFLIRLSQNIRHIFHEKTFLKWRLGSWVWLNLAVLTVVFLASGFADSTGRYLLPLWIPLSFGLALALDKIRVDLGWAVAVVMVLTLLLLHISAVLVAVQQPTGIETQLDSGLRTPPNQDEVLLRFLEDEGYTYGYSSYWLSYRMMFRFDERIILDTSLPIDDNGYRANDNRYEPYTEAVAAADHVFWVTHHFAELDTLIETLFARDGIDYRVMSIGDYRIYFDFSEKVAPSDYNLNRVQSLNSLRQELLGNPSSTSKKSPR